MSLKGDLAVWLSRPSRRIASLRTKVAALRADAPQAGRAISGVNRETALYLLRADTDATAIA